MLSSLFPGETLPNGDLPIIAGPCSIESQEQIYETMRRLKECGIGMALGSLGHDRVPSRVSGRSDYAGCARLLTSWDSKWGRRFVYLSMLG